MRCFDPHYGFVMSGIHHSMERMQTNYVVSLLLDKIAHLADWLLSIPLQIVRMYSVPWETNDSMGNIGWQLLCFSDPTYII